MADFRIKLITFAGAAAMFAGMAHAQVACTAANPTTSVFVRAESNDDQVGDTTLNCTSTAAAATINLTVYMSPTVNITSATLGSGSSAKNESQAGLTTTFPVGGGAPAIYGSVSGNSVTFNGIAGPGVAGAFNITITNIKIQASTIGAPTGIPTGVNETIFVAGTGVSPGVITTASPVAFVINGLTGVKVGGPNSNNSVSNNAICNQITANAQNFTVSFGENFPTAFKVQGTVALNAGLNSWYTNNTETGYGTTVNGGNQATAGTRVSIAFANVPTGVNMYVPLTIGDSVAGVGLMQLVTSATGAKTLVTAASTSGNNAPAANYGQVVISSGSGTAVYEYVTNDSNTTEKYTFNVDLQASGGVVTAPSGAITATVSFGPIGSSTSVPNFISGSSTATLNGSTFIACSSTLLFPFVTNQLGFDTGLAISNTSSDLLASGGTKTQAANQSGTCTLNFFGNTAPAAVTTASIATGTTYAAAASTLAPGFQGYLIANCNFLYGHGFAYVVYNLTQNNGAAMGYLADVINADRKSTVAVEQSAGSNAPEN